MTHVLLNETRIVAILFNFLRRFSSIGLKLDRFASRGRGEAISPLLSTVTLFTFEHCLLFSSFLFCGMEWERAIHLKLPLNGEIGAKSSMVSHKCYRRNKISSKRSSTSENFSKTALKCSMNDGSLIFVFTRIISLRSFYISEILWNFSSNY